MKLRPYQIEAVNCVSHELRKEKRALIVAATGCHHPEALILMADGQSKLARNVRVGDKLLGPDARPRTVLELHHGFEEMFEVSSKKINPFVVNGSHIMAMYVTPRTAGKPAEYDTCAVNQWESQGTTYKHRRYLYRPGVPMKFENEFSNFIQDVDPYLMGAYLADGSSGLYKGNTKTLVLHKNFTSWAEMLDRSISDLKPFGYRVSHVFDKLRPLRAFMTVARGKLGKRLGGRQNLWTLRLLTAMQGDIKKVPKSVKFGTVEARARFLAGVLDGDGHCDGNAFELTLKHKSQIEDLRFIGLSLGLCVSKIATKKVKLKDWDEARLYYRIHLTGNFDLLPLCEKKITEGRQKNNPSIFKPTIKPVGVGEFYGWEVDGDNLYLDADFIVHHNSGKSICAATIAQRVIERHPSWRILILCYVQEILQSNDQACKDLGLDSGIYCAGLGQRKTTNSVIHASRDSLARTPNAAGQFEIVILDECHLLGDDADSRYSKLLKELDPKYIVGMTATPYRLDGGYIYGKRKFWPRVCYDIGHKKLVDQGYLVPYVFPPPIKTLVDTTGVKKKAGEFDAQAIESLVNSDAIIKASLSVWQEHAFDRRCTLFFCHSLAHSAKCLHFFKERFPDLAATSLDGKTDKRERSQLIDDMRDGKYRALFQVGTMTTGTNIPIIDCITWLRPTASATLWVQGSGRGSRLFEGKLDCLIVDVVGNMDQFASIYDPVLQYTPTKKDPEFSPEDLIDMGIDPDEFKGNKATKECPICRALLSAAARKCDSCGHLFIKMTDVHRQNTEPVKHPVKSASYRYGLTQAGKPCMICSYITNAGREFKEWVMHEETWDMARAQERKELIDQRAVGQIVVKPNPKNPRFPKIQLVSKSSSGLPLRGLGPKASSAGKTIAPESGTSAQKDSGSSTAWEISPASLTF